MKFIPCLGYESGTPLTVSIMIVSMKTLEGLAAMIVYAMGELIPPYRENQLKKPRDKSTLKSMVWQSMTPKYLEEENKNG